MNPSNRCVNQLSFLMKSLFHHRILFIIPAISIHHNITINISLIFSLIIFFYQALKMNLTRKTVIFKIILYQMHGWITNKQTKIVKVMFYKEKFRKSTNNFCKNISKNQIRYKIDIFARKYSKFLWYYLNFGFIY